MEKTELIEYSIHVLQIVDYQIDFVQEVIRTKGMDIERDKM